MSEKKFSEMNDDEIWRDLRIAVQPDLRKIAREMISEPLNVEPGWCCLAVQNAMTQGLHHIALAAGCGFIFVRVFHCPRCGKKLRG